MNIEFAITMHIGLRVSDFCDQADKSSQRGQRLMQRESRQIVFTDFRVTMSAVVFARSFRARGVRLAINRARERALSIDAGCPRLTQ